MANEIRGLLFETIAEEALKRAVKQTGIAGEVFWNEKPQNMSIKPDFTVGPNKDKPSHVVLVTATGAARNAEMKSWRNFGEFFEAKSQLDSNPIIINLYFMSELKTGLAEATELLYDTTLHADKAPYYRSIDLWVSRNLRSAIKTKDAKRKLLTESLTSNSELASSIDALAHDLAAALQTRNAALDPLWRLMREDYLKPHTPPTARTTSIRRGLGKLLILEPHIRKMIYDAHGKLSAIPLKDLPDYVFELGFLIKRVSGAVLNDNEIAGVINTLGPETCERILQIAPSSMATWFSPLRDLKRVAAHVDWVAQHYKEVTDPTQLESLLVECYKDPVSLCGVLGDDKVWVFEIMVSLLKARSGKLQGYGLAQLAVDAAVPEFGQGGFLIPPFAQREKMLSPEHLTSLATGLAKRFAADLPESALPKLRSEVITWVVKENLEDRLIPYRNFEPLLWLLEAELERQGVAYIAKAACPGWVNEYSGVGQKSATTPFVKVGKTLVHWKTVSDLGKFHKRKELAARARSVRYQFRSSTGEFIRRKGVDQLALIVDGTFDDSDLKVLSESGWDTIIYADEISGFVTDLKARGE